MILSQILNQSPKFHSWVQQKKLNKKDLDILTEFQDFKKIEPALTWIACYQPSHSQGCQILELSCELLLMNKVLQNHFNEFQNSKTLIQKLKQLRYPLASSFDQKKQKKLKELVKSNLIQTKWIRHQDTAYLEVVFKSSSSEDLEKKIQSLKHIQKSLENSFWQA